MLIANWKMNKDFDEVTAWLRDFKGLLGEQQVENKLAICPPALYLKMLREQLPSWIKLGAQNCAAQVSGAYTGEISPQMLHSLRIDLTLVGHSERRQGFGEDNAVVAAKVKNALGAGLQVVLCVGETLEVREANRALDFVSGQIDDALAGLDPQQQSNIIIAYEPIWAIGTGLVPSMPQLQEMFSGLQQHYGYNKFLYGGSVNAKNITEILSIGEIAGALVGGASLKADEFAEMFRQYIQLR